MSGNATIPSSLDVGGAWAFSRHGAQRIERVVKRVEATLRNVPPQRGRYPVGPGAAVLIPCSITSNVTAGSESSPTSFTATLLLRSGSGPGLTTSGGASITAYNRAPGIAFTASGGAPKSGWLTLLFGFYYLVSADC